MDQPQAIELRGLVRRFGERIVLRDVSASVPAGATLAVLGRNGAGKPTLPLIHALQHGSDQQRAIIRDAIQRGGLARLEPVIAAIDATGGLEYATRIAREHAAQAQAALAALTESPCRKGLAALAAFSVEHTT